MFADVRCISDSRFSAAIGFGGGLIVTTKIAEHRSNRGRETLPPIL